MKNHQQQLERDIENLILLLSSTIIYPKLQNSFKEKNFSFREISQKETMYLSDAQFNRYLDCIEKLEEYVDCYK